MKVFYAQALVRPATDCAHDAVFHAFDQDQNNVAFCKPYDTIADKKTEANALPSGAKLCIRCQGRLYTKQFRAGH